MRRLALKELREHGWVLLALTALFALGLWALSRGADEGGKRFEALRGFVTTFGLVGALVACNRLVVREYTGKTQLFLEVLPITRAQVALTKWLLGFAWVLLTTVAAWAWVWAWQTAVVEPLDALRALVPAALWLSAFFSVCFVAGLLGRWRVAFWASAAMGAYLLDEVAQLQPSAVAPFHIVSEVMTSGRSWPAQRDVLACLGLTLGGLVLGVGLVSWGAGSIPAALAGRTTSRERLLTAVFALALFAVAGLLTKDRKLPPFKLDAVAPLQTAAGPIGVLAGEGVPKGAAEALVTLLADDVVGLTAALKLPPVAGVYVVSQQGLDPDVLVRTPLEKKDGVVLRANLADPRFDALALRSTVLHAILSDATRRQALVEERHWLLDGLATYWPTRGDAAARARLRRRAGASPVALTLASASRWDETLAQAGECLAGALGFTLVDTLVAQLGEAGMLELARQAFPKPRGDVRDALLGPKLSALLEEKGLAFDALVAQAEAARREGGAPLGYAGALELRPQGGGQVQVQLSLERSGAAVVRWRGRVASVGAWETSVSTSDGQRVDARAKEAVVNASYASGERLFTAIEVDEETLGCSARVFQRWLVVP